MDRERAGSASALSSRKDRETNGRLASSSTPDLKKKSTSSSNGGTKTASSLSSLKTGAGTSNGFKFSAPKQSNGTASRPGPTGRPEEPQKHEFNAVADFGSPQARTRRSVPAPFNPTSDAADSTHNHNPGSPQTLPALSSTIDAALNEFKLATAQRRSVPAAVRVQQRRNSPFHSDGSLERVDSGQSRPSTAMSLFGDAPALLTAGANGYDEDANAELTPLVEELLSAPTGRSAQLARTLQFNGALFLETNVRHWVDKLGSQGDSLFSSTGEAAIAAAVPLFTDLADSLQNYLRAVSRLMRVRLQTC